MDSLNNMRQKEGNMKLGGKIEQTDILQTPKLKENPFSLPQAYFTCVEEELNAKIKASDKENIIVDEPSRFGLLKASFALTIVFGIIIGLGYLVLDLTNTSQIKSNIELAQQNEDILNNDNTILADSLSKEFGLKNDNAIKTEDIEEYLLDSNISIITLASLE